MMRNIIVKVSLEDENQIEYVLVLLDTKWVFLEGILFVLGTDISVFGYFILLD